MTIHQTAVIPPRSKGQSVDVVYARLRHYILNGTLEPGAELTQAQLARELGVSRTPLREALRMLTRDGLVAGEPNHSLRVTRISPRTMDEHWAVRIGLEAIAIRAAVPLLTGRDLAALEGDLTQMDCLGAYEDFDAFETVHRAFHLRMVKPAGEEILQTIAELTDRGARYRRMWTFLLDSTMQPRSAGAHRTIVEACTARDPDGAAAANAHHLANFAYAVMEALHPAFQPVLVPIAVEIA